MAKRLRVEYLERCVGCYQCTLACARVIEKVLSVGCASINVKTVGGYKGSTSRLLYWFLQHVYSRYWREALSFR